MTLPIHHDDSKPVVYYTEDDLTVPYVPPLDKGEKLAVATCAVASIVLVALSSWLYVVAGPVLSMCLTVLAMLPGAIASAGAKQHWDSRRGGHPLFPHLRKHDEMRYLAWKGSQLKRLRKRLNRLHLPAIWFVLSREHEICRLAGDVIVGPGHDLSDLPEVIARTLHEHETALACEQYAIMEEVAQKCGLSVPEPMMRQQLPRVLAQEAAMAESLKKDTSENTGL